ncbi:MAG: twin-arginine translocase subunit TatC [Candidatus Bathyarchaeota archaeon]|nr:MAG: twin-arginine translocase subunit TatC [Candidatus Bathyarchaeota archaeon]
MNEKKKAELTFWGHLAELLNRVRMILYSVIISSIVVMVVPIGADFSVENPFYTTIASFTIKNLQEKFLPDGAMLLPLSFTAPLEVYIFVSIILGVTISLPVISYELYKFINPALRKDERKAALQFVASFAGLFILGFVIGYLFVIPATMRMLFSFSSLLDLPPTYDFAAFFSIVGFSLLLCGLVFTFPTYIVLLVKAGILKTRHITKNRKYLYGVLLIIIALLDPEPGLITEGFVFIPLVILTEISIIISRRIEKSREMSG